MAHRITARCVGRFGTMQLRIDGLLVSAGPPHQVLSMARSLNADNQAAHKVYQLMCRNMGRPDTDMKKS